MKDCGVRLEGLRLLSKLDTTGGALPIGSVAQERAKKISDNDKNWLGWVHVAVHMAGIPSKVVRCWHCQGSRCSSSRLIRYKKQFRDGV